jgi:HEAT repeat protein
MGLSNIGNAAACDLLVKFAEDKQEPDNDMYARALASVSSPYGQQALLDILKTDQYSPEIRSAAARALGNYESTDVREALLVVADKESDASVRIDIYRATDNIEEIIGPSTPVLPVDGVGLVEMEKE